MAWAYLAINSLILVGAALLGWRLRKLRIWQFAAWVGLAGALLALRAYLHAHPEHEQLLLRLSDDYVYFASWEAPLALLMVFALAARLPGAKARRAAVLSLGLLAPLFAWNNVALCLQPDYGLTAHIDAEGVYRQSTDYSCGPAAALMLLRAAGIPATEGDVAELCMLRPGQGVTALELCRGLNVMLRPAGRKAVLRRIRPDELGDLHEPFLAEVRRPQAAYHCVVVLRVEPDALHLADPARGRAVQTKDEFLRQWTGLVLCTEPVS